MEPWSNLLSNLESDEIESVFLCVCDHSLNNTSRVATNTPPELPRHDSGVSGVSAEENNDTKLLRRSDGVDPACEDSTAVSEEKRPTRNDFDNAFWASTKQNGITQYWAPRYTASPHNNAKESARILHLPSLKAAVVAQHIRKECTAVDLSAGTGSFAFNYAAAGVQKVLCWDPSPWSIEGLRRGALKNRWHIQVHHGDQMSIKGIKVSSKTRLVAFVEPGDRALDRIQGVRNSLPPVRHVNCGVFPTSRNLYATAVTALDPSLGGWIHVHETFGEQEVACKANEARAEFEAILQRLDRERGYLTDIKGAIRRPVVEHVQRVGSYAPGVFRCVVDIHVPPIQM